MKTLFSRFHEPLIPVMPKPLNAEDWIRQLALVPHPEGGYYRQTYQASELIPHSALPARFSGSRSFSTAIYFLLKHPQVSRFHRIQSDEIWHFYTGSGLTISILQDGKLRQERLGADIGARDSFQVVVPANCWFAASVNTPGAFSLLGCTVAPGFDFADFELATAEALIQAYPDHAQLITEMC